tara:strand:- start:311 stop:856 length:546 start_codon:yes stop_codon:yes gene_type:complete
MSARAEAKKKALQRAQQKRNERKLKLLNTPKKTGGKSKTTVKKGLSNIPKEGTRAGKLKMAGQGMSGLKNYKKDELKLSKAATKASEKLKKESNQKKKVVKKETPKKVIKSTTKGGPVKDGVKYARSKGDDLAGFRRGPGTKLGKDTRITKSLKKSGFTEDRLARLRKQHAEFKAKRKKKK